MKLGGKRVASPTSHPPLLLKVFLGVIAATWLQLIWVVGRIEINHENTGDSESISVGVNVVASVNQNGDRMLINPTNKLEQKPPSHLTSNDSSSQVSKRWKVPVNPDPTVAQHLSFAWRHYQNQSQEVQADQDSLLLNLQENCSSTSQVELYISHDGSWRIQSFDANGNKKSEGGDEFYAAYHEPYKVRRSMRPDLVLPDSLAYLKKRSIPLAVAHVEDNEDGTYSLDFVRSPFANSQDPIVEHPKNYVSVYLDYTCGVSKIPQPQKQSWFTGGALMTEWTVENVTDVPPVRAFQPPNQDGKIDLGKYDQVLCYGDSNMRNIVTYLSRDTTDNLHMIGETQTPLQEAVLKRKFLPKTKYAVEAALKASNDTTTTRPKLAVLIGSNTWDVVFGVKHSATYDSHLKACRQWVEELRESFPTVDVYWFPGYSLHAHVVGLKQTDSWPEVKPLKYMSYYRAWQLYRWQKELMQELNVPMIDAFEASFLSAEKTVMGDARHYVTTFVVPAIGWYYPNRTRTSLVIPL